MQQHCFIKLDGETTQPLLVPFVKDHGLSEQSLAQYQRDIYEQQGALAAPEVDRLLEESRQEFLAAASRTLNLIPSEDDESAEGTRTAPAKAPIPIWNRDARSSSAESRGSDQKARKERLSSQLEDRRTVGRLREFSK